MKITLAIICTLSLLSCETKEHARLGDFVTIEGISELVAEVPQLVHQIDTVVAIAVVVAVIELKPKIDTSTLERKRAFILNEFKTGQESLAYVHDTLMDLNFDSFPDLVIETHTIAGRGMRNGVEAYVFNDAKKCYVRDTFFSAMENPSFYLENNRMSSFQLSYGSGAGQEYEWYGGEWNLAKAFEVTNYGKSSVWKVTYAMTDQEALMNYPFNKVPPQEVIQHKFEDTQH
ncbi:MAG: hypothetical protein HRT57_07395 [Crocinitomicaceae bacterium]|nr:hypothetical protein [Crocinitomicaceae bacterium]